MTTAVNRGNDDNDPKKKAEAAAAEAKTCLLYTSDAADE